MVRSVSGHDNGSAQDNGARPQRSRRAMLAGGAAGALGVFGFEALAKAPQAQAQASLSGGEFTSGVAPAAVTLSQSSGSVAVNASLGNVFTLTLTASGWAIANPASPVGDGQAIWIWLTQDSTGGRTVTWGSGYNWGTVNGVANSAPALSTTPHATDILSFEYDAALSQWCYLGAAFPQGYGGIAKPPTISVVQSVYVSLDTQGNFNSDVTAGNSIVLVPAIYSNAGSGAISTSDPQFGSVGNSVPGTMLVSNMSPYENSDAVYTAIWLLPDVAGGSSFFRLNGSYPSPGGPHGTLAFEIAGLGSAPQLDPAGGVASATGYSATVNSGACPPITQPEEIIFGFGHILSVNLSTPSAAWTAVIGGTDPDFWVGYQIVDVPGSAYDWSQTGTTTGTWGAGIAAICPQVSA
jgi:hypothetical protein